MAAHGHLRVTTDVDLILTEDGLASFKSRWLGRGWVERFEGSRGMRDTVHGVAVDVLLTGDFPGDGEPKEVAFPEPADASELRDGMRVLRLPVLVELKLASGQSAPHRLKNLADVIDLIRVNALPAGFGGQLGGCGRSERAFDSALRATSTHSRRLSSEDAAWTRKSLVPRDLRSSSRASVDARIDRRRAPCHAATSNEIRSRHFCHSLLDASVRETYATCGAGRRSSIPSIRQQVSA